MAALFGIEMIGPDVGFQGFRDPRAIAAVMARARATAIKQQLIILLVMLTVGALLGGLGALCGRAWDVSRDRKPRLGMLRGALAALGGHAWFFAHSIIHYPQLYSAHLYAKGGTRRAVMVFLTDRVPPLVLDLVLVLVLMLVLVPPAMSPRGRTALASLGKRALAAVRRRPALAAGLLVLVCALPLWRLVRPTPRGAATAGKPNLILIAVDSLRPDRVFGDTAPARFPAMAELAARGVRFRDAHVTHARTFPSYVTLVSGRFPYHHGIRHEFPPAATRQAIGPTLVSALRDSGYRTAVVADYSGDIFPRTPFGFDAIDTPHMDLYKIVEQQMLVGHPNVLPYCAGRIGERLFPAMRSMAEFDDPALLAERALAQLDALARGPFFLSVFFSAPHSPYVAPDPYYRSFTDPEYQGVFRYLKEPLPALPAVPPVDQRHIQALYDGAVAAVDAAVARLVRRVEELGLQKDTLIVLLGDHGENLFEVPGRGMGHGDHLWGDLANHIPLVIVDPVHAPPAHDVRGLVRDVDLAPTLARLVGVPAPPADGVDLSPLVRGERDSLDLEAYAETGLWLLTGGPGYRQDDRLPYPDVWNATEAAPDGDIYLQPRWETAQRVAKYRAIRTPRWKLVYQPAPDGAHWRLFDVQGDREQRQDVAAAHPTEVAELRRKLEAFITADGTALAPDAPH
jgi:arylsulfatase A-like enzyme